MKPILNFLLVSIFLSASLNGHSQSNKAENNKYVIVLDVQPEYVNNLNPGLSSEFIESINIVIENSDPDKVIYVSSLHLALSISFKSIKVDTLVSLDVDSNVRLVNDIKFIKDEADAFTVKELVDFFKDNNATDIIVIGLLAEKCVTRTLIGGIDLGYKMYVIPEAIIGKTENRKNKAIEKLTKKGVVEIGLSDYVVTSI